MIPLLLSGCLGNPGNGTFVGNPGANLEAATPPAAEGAPVDGSATLVRAELDPCDGGEVAVVVPEDGDAAFTFGVDRTALPVGLPGGRWCRLSLVLQDVTVGIPTLGGALALGDVTVVLDDGAFEVRPTKKAWTLVLGAQDWLAGLDEVAAQDPDPQTLADLEVALGAGSSLYDPAGTQVIRGPGHVPFDQIPPECDLPPRDLGPVISDCDTAVGYEVYTHVAERTCETGLFVGAIYETRDEGGVARVTFDVPGIHYLALSAYEPTRWEVSVGPRTQLLAVLVAGYGRQEVVGASAPVVPVPGPACGYSLPYNGGGCDTDALLEALETVVHRPVTRFDGCYEASTFSWVE